MKKPDRPKGGRMNRDQANRIIHRARGFCWHEFEPMAKQAGHLDYDYMTCKYCRKHVKPSDQGNMDYFTAEGFFVCWKWARSQEWWEDFMDTIELCWISDKKLRPLRYHMEELVDYLVFASEVADFLKGMDESESYLCPRPAPTKRDQG